MNAKAGHPPVRAFADLSLADRVTAGRKAATLGELRRLGIRVPDGFVVAADAFEQFMQTVLPEKNANDPGTVTRRMENAPFPPEVHAAIARAYRALSLDDFRPDLPVAVRSSVDCNVQMETSLAGLHDSYLSVRGINGVLHAVRSCWATLYGAGIAENDITIGVIVQKMVSSQSSGVMYTRHPETGDRSVVMISGSWGLSANVTNDVVTEDTFVVNKATGEIANRTVSEKLLQHLPDHFGGGVRLEAVPADRQKAACLTDFQIVELAQTGKRIERQFGVSQIIDWAIAPDERGVYILQSRPDTVTGARPQLVTPASQTDVRRTARLVRNPPRT
jgi:pyruvate,water dikinase